MNVQDKQVKIVDILSNLSDIPVSYNHFKTKVEPPYITFYRANNFNYLGDDSIYLKLDTFKIEVYDSERNFNLETRIDTLLEENELIYNKDEVYIRQEELYLLIYTITL